MTESPAQAPKAPKRRASEAASSPSAGAGLPTTKRGRDTREAILRAAEEVIGAKGYSASGIIDITRAAGIAQGTFYIYFDGKEAVFRTLVAEMGRYTRRTLSEAVAGAKDRLEAERLGLRAFLEIAATRPTLYSIVEEARFVAPEAYDAYFTSFAQSYIRNLEAAAREGTIRPGNAEIRAWALMGLAVTLGERYGQRNPGADRDQVVAEVFDMLERGLRP